MPQRDLYIDRLRSVMTALVILHHTALTYGAIGGWFWREVEPSRTPSGILLILFCTTNQAYFMGFFFLLAGYFTPASLDRKGYSRFIADRFMRLGIPLLAFGLLLGPLTAAFVEHFRGDSFWGTFVWLWRHKEFINGPLWFAQALLIFSLVYCAWRALSKLRATQGESASKPIPAYPWWLLSALGVGAFALALRQFAPVGVNVFGLQLAYFSAYVFLFAVGIVAGRNDWLRRLSWKHAWPWVVTACLVWPTLPLGWMLSHGKINFNTGFSWGAILYAFWEPFVAWGLIAAWLLLFRKYMSGPSVFWTWLNRRAYAVYILHPPVLVGISLLLHGWAAPALLKFGAVGLLACIATWIVSDPFVRIPGVRSVV